MSAPRKVKAVYNKKQTYFSSEVTVSSKTFREVQQYVECCTTKSGRSSVRSISDRRSNGRVVGSDARVIETYPDFKIDIRGIGNHEKCSLSSQCRNSNINYLH